MSSPRNAQNTTSVSDEASEGVASSAEQFNAQAGKYATSAVHRFGPSLPVLLEYAAPCAEDMALDVATGTGNTALALAPAVGQVMGLDVAEQMLAHARGRAAQEGLDHARFITGSAEALPFPDGSFTLVTSRHAPHHFRHLDRFLAEAFRVLRPGGRLVIADQISPTPGVQAWTDRYQRLRDPSHFAQRTVQAWRSLAARSGFTWVRDTLVPYRLEFDWWTAQSGCTPETVQGLRDLLIQLDPDEQRVVGAEFGPDGEPVAHVDQMMVARLDRPAQG